MTGAWLFASMFLGAVGTGFLVFGIRQKRWPQLVVGVALSVYPFFVSSILVMLGIAAALLVGLWLALRSGL